MITNIYWLVVTGTMEFYDFPIILGLMDYSGLMDFNGCFHILGIVIIPTDELHDFSEG